MLFLLLLLLVDRLAFFLSSYPHTDSSIISAFSYIFIQFTIVLSLSLSLPLPRVLYFHFYFDRFLSVKKWLLRKKHQIELARKRGWKGYWVCLKGTTLLFYPCDSREGRTVDSAPKHLIIVDGAIMQPIPEHPKRDYIFCLSTAFGDAYLFQAPCQVSSFFCLLLLIMLRPFHHGFPLLFSYPKKIDFF